MREAHTAAATTAAMMIGSPGGVSGIHTIVATAHTTAIAIGSRPCSRGHSRPRKAAHAAPSKPHLAGSPIALPARAPTRVNVFHITKTPRPAVQKPRLCSSGVSWAVALAIDSSMVNWAYAGAIVRLGRSIASSCMP